MNKLILLILTLYFAQINITFAQEPKDYELGDSYMYSKQYEKAMEEYSKIISKYPGDVYGLYKRGVAFLYMNQFDAAINDFSEVLKVNKDDPDAFNNRGLAYSYKGSLELAMKDFDNAIKNDNGFSQAYINRGSALIALKEYDKAMKDLDKAIKLEPKNPEIFLQRARLFYIKEDFPKAIKDYSTAIALGLANSKLYYNRANAYFKLKKYDEAIKDYTSALELDPDDLDALNNRSYTYHVMGKEQEAEIDKAELEGRKNAMFTPIESINFVPFNISGGELTLDLPDTWKVIEMPQENTDKSEYIITPEDVNLKTEGMMVGVTIGIMRNLNKQFQIVDEPGILEFWKGSMDLSNEDMLIYKVNWQRHMQFDDHPTILNRSMIQATENHIPFGLFEYAIAWGDSLIYLYFQAPEVNFDYFEKIYERAYKSLKIKDNKDSNHEIENKSLKINDNLNSK
jgi:tetratricopeptide (TPR) repeat protein